MAAPQEIHGVYRLGIWEEASGSFAVNQSGSVSYSDLKVISSEIVPMVTMLDDTSIGQRKDTRFTAVSGPRGVTATVSTYLCSLGSAITTTSPSMTALGKAIRNSMGGFFQVTGSTTSGTQTATVLTSSLGGNSFKVGSHLGIVNTTTGRLETARVLSGSGNNIWLQNGLSFVPATAAQIYGSHTFFMTMDPSGSVQLFMEGLKDTDKWVAMGCQGGFSMNLPVGQLPTIDFTYEGANWATGSAGSLGVASYGGGSPIDIVDSEVRFYVAPAAASSVTANARVDVASVAVTPAIAFTPVPSFGGVNNKLRWVRGKSTNGVCAGTITKYFDGVTYFDARNAGTIYGLQIQIGSSAGDTVVLSFPRVQITDVKRVDANGLAGEEISWIAMEDTVCHPNSGFEDLGRSAFSISFL